MPSIYQALTQAALEITPPAVEVEGSTKDTPVSRISSDALMSLGAKLRQQFEAYRSDRRIAELRWLRNQRQYLGVYDPEIEKEMNVNRSKAYPRITRVKCLTVLAKIMDLMFPGNERNWELSPAPDPDITVDDVKAAIAAQQKRDTDAGIEAQPVTPEYAMDAVHEMMLDRASKLSVVIDDQLQELGGDQTYDYISLNRSVIRSGINYGLGLLRGPFARESRSVVWEMDDEQGVPMPKSKKVYRPFYEFVSIWDFYPDMSAKTFASMSGYFLRKILSRSQVHALAKRPDFFADAIEAYLATHEVGNYIPLEYEQELRVMGVKANVNEMKPDTQKYQLHVWCGKLGGDVLRLCGCDVPDDRVTNEFDAEVWMIDGNIIKCKLDPWKKLGWDVNMLHHFLFDEDDTSPIGFGLPNAMRDSQMMVSAATRMLLDNASVTCGPNLELNTDLLRGDQDLTSLRSYRMWYREGTDAAAQWPAVRNVQIDAHMKDLMEIIELGLKFADSESFVGPADGGDASQMPSEPMRTAAGASMLRGNSALPFKDMVRSFDHFTQSVIYSLVAFNRLFNPSKAHLSDCNVIARGATSLIAKEVKGMQADQLTSTLTPEEKLHVDGRKLLAVRLKSRDMEDIMVSESEAARRQAQQDQQTEKQQDQQDRAVEANTRKVLTDAYKNLAAGQKNLSSADAETISSFLEVLERGLTINGSASAAQNTDPQAAGGGAGGPDMPGEGAGPAGPGLPGATDPAAGGVQGQPGDGGQPADIPGNPG